jgi:hypothetical protein
MTLQRERKRSEGWWGQGERDKDQQMYGWRYGWIDR